jgi:hypothetical protein
VTRAPSGWPRSSLPALLLIVLAVMAIAVLLTGPMQPAA